MPCCSACSAREAALTLPVCSGTDLPAGAPFSQPHSDSDPQRKLSAMIRFANPDFAGKRDMRGTVESMKRRGLPIPCKVPRCYGGLLVSARKIRGEFTSQANGQEKGQNPNLEARNPKQTPIPKRECSKRGDSHAWFRISDLLDMRLRDE